MGDVLPNLEWSLRLQEVEEHLYSKLPFMGIRSGATTENINLRGLFTLREMRKATNDFDQVLQIGFGEGGFSKVYRGAIDGGATHTAIKRARPETDDQIQKGWCEFLKEVEMLSRLRHRHIVPLIGCCVGKSEMILVYDYMARGNLRQHLYESQKPPLTWKRRLQICIGVARSLHYLHAEATSHHVIIHRGVHTSNILLDYNWVAKLSDFGLSSMQDLVSSTEKSDVYSFGVVLLEVLCARPALDTTLPENQAELAKWALHCHKNGMVEECIDPHLKGKITPECLNMFVETAAKCLAKADNGMDSRAMGVVLRNLEFTLHLEENVEVPLWWWPSTIRPSQTELPKQSRESSWMPFSCRQFSLAETKLATRNFDEALCIGDGMFGKVYKGAIEGVGTDVAIKRADHQEQQELETVMTTLSMLCHRNLVSLVGYCKEDSRMILVYDYAGRGNLQQHLYWSGKPRLPWEQRLRICTEVARILSYLHAGAAANYAIVHRNVKTTNILLNNEWVPKLSGFERPKRTSAHGHPDMKLDVYSFGVVLFEVLCTCPELDRGRSLPGRALHCLKNDTLEEIIDPHLKGQITSECLKLFVEVAQKCLVDQPAMGDVVRHLELALQLQLKESSNIEED